MAKRKSKSQLPDTLFEAKEKTQPRKPVAKRRFKWWQLLGVGMLGLCACSWLLTTLNIIPDTQERAATQTVAALAAGDIASNVRLVSITSTPAATLTENPLYTAVPTMIFGLSGVQFTLEGFEIRGGIHLIVYGTLYNPTARQECVRAVAMRVYLDGREYRPDNGLMDTIKPSVNRDFIGAYFGQCVEAGTMAATFAAFEISPTWQTAELSFNDIRQPIGLISGVLLTQQVTETAIKLNASPIAATFTMTRTSVAQVQPVVFATATTRPTLRPLSTATPRPIPTTIVPTVRATNTLVPATITPIPATATLVPPTIIPVPTTALLVSTTNITPLSPAQTFYVGTAANIRECPNATTCAVIIQLASGVSITVNAIAVGQEVNPGNANWYRFDYQGREAYVYSGVVSSTPPTVQNPPVASGGGQTTTSSQPVTSGGQSQSPTLANCTVTVANSGQPWNCSGNLYNCPNFCTYSDVQSYWNACPGDPSDLDGNKDGTPCEPSNWR